MRTHEMLNGLTARINSRLVRLLLEVPLQLVRWRPRDPQRTQNFWKFDNNYLNKKQVCIKNKSMQPVALVF